MKIVSICAVILISIFSPNQSFSQKSVVKETLKVWGNCGMCKKTIEQSAKSAGARTADWNEETKQLVISFSPIKTTSARIQEAIAKAGYDTRDVNADNKAYDALHSCCQYERKENAALGEKANACCKDGSESKDMKICKEMTDCKGRDCCKM